jgi:Tfp pilus assembly protein FimV
LARGWRAELKRYGAPVAFLAAVTIAVLLVRAGLRSEPAATPTTIATTTTSTIPRPHGPRFYRLRAGETLSDVAVRFDTTVQRLRALNPRVNPNALRVGQRIRLR